MGSLAFDGDCKAPLGAVFVLKKDREDYLSPLSGMATARALVEGFLTVYRRHVAPPQGIQCGMRTLCALARKVPGYELHFRKRLNFWGLIDEL